MKKQKCCAKRGARTHDPEIKGHRKRCRSSSKWWATCDHDDRFMVLQHPRNSRLTAAATVRQYGIHPQTVRNRFRENVQPVRAYRPYFGQMLTRRHLTVRRDWSAVTCTSNVLIGI